MNPRKHAGILRKALAKAGVGDIKGPTHDLRVTSLTQGWLASGSRSELMPRAGHSDFKTTQIYINAAGELFRYEAERLEVRIFGHTVGHNRPVAQWIEQRFPKRVGKCRSPYGSRCSLF